MVHVHLHIPGNPAGSTFDPARDSAHPLGRAAARSGARARVWAVEEAGARPSESEVTGMTPLGPAVSAPLWEELFMGTGTAVLADPHVVTCTLAPRFEAVRTAREFARSTLNGWGLGELFDDVSLVASELVTNALRHALGARRDEWSAIAPGLAPTGAPQAADESLPIRISLVHRAPQLVCAVSDPSCAGPIAREPDFVAESGRGLHLVDSFSRSWGWHPLAGAGKVVWALFEAKAQPEPALAPSGRHRRSA